MSTSISGALGGVQIPPLPPEVVAEDYGWQLVTVCAIFIVLQVAAVGGRLVARRMLKTGFFLDDYLIVAAAVRGHFQCADSKRRR